MPLTRPALDIAPGPRSVHGARRWVGEILRELGREELVDSAQLAVSELVTNAILHGAFPVSVAVRGTPDRPRIEVRDASLHLPELPQLPGADEHGTALDATECGDPLATVGRGLTLVARSSWAWGIDVDPEGKVAWCCPRPEMVEGAAPSGVVSGTARLAGADLDPPTATLPAVPTRLVADLLRHLRELSREARLVALSLHPRHALAVELSDVLAVVTAQLQVPALAHQVRVAEARGALEVSLEVQVAADGATPFPTALRLLSAADELCRGRELLALARTPEQVAFQTWYAEQLGRLRQGLTPSAFETHVEVAAHR